MHLSLERFSFGRSFLIGSLFALAAGVAGGSLSPEGDGGAVAVFVRIVQALGAAWVRALRMTILPLVVSLLVVAVIGSEKRMGVARLGGAAVAVYLGIYLALAALAAVLYPPLIRAFGIARGSVSGLRMEAAPPVGGLGGLEPAEWLLEVIPTNPFAAAAEENILQVVVFTIAFAVAVGRLAPGARDAVLALFTPVANAMLVILAWLMRVSPVAVFGLAFAAAREIGIEAAWVLVSFAILTTIVMTVAILGLAPVAGVLGRVGTLRFVRAAWPGQVLAVATRSSLATVPALVEGAKSRLGLSDRITGFGIPFAASTFKPNRLISSPGKLLFLAWIYGIPIEPIGYAMFVGYVILLAATTVGVPNQGGRNATLPAYVALGIPVEGIVLINSVDMLWDYAATALNTTGYLASTCLLPRAATASAAEPAAEPAIP